MEYIEWYTQPEGELRELCADVNYRTQMENRLADLRKINYHGVRCHMSKSHEEKLARILEGL